MLSLTEIAAVGALIVVSAGLAVNAWNREPSAKGPVPSTSAPATFGAVEAREGDASRPGLIQLRGVW